MRLRGCIQGCLGGKLSMVLVDRDSNVRINVWVALALIDASRVLATQTCFTFE
jgi:hypothetical protein